MKNCDCNWMFSRYLSRTLRFLWNNWRNIIFLYYLMDKSWSPFPQNGSSQNPFTPFLPLNHFRLIWWSLCVYLAFKKVINQWFQSQFMQNLWRIYWVVKTSPITHTSLLKSLIMVNIQVNTSMHVGSFLQTLLNLILVP